MGALPCIFFKLYPLIGCSNRNLVYSITLRPIGSGNFASTSDGHLLSAGDHEKYREN